MIVSGRSNTPLLLESGKYWEVEVRALGSQVTVLCRVDRVDRVDLMLLLVGDDRAAFLDHRVVANSNRLASAV